MISRLTFFLFDCNDDHWTGAGWEVTIHELRDLFEETFDLCYPCFKAFEITKMLVSFDIISYFCLEGI
jgi:hypothetical protein